MIKEITEKEFQTSVIESGKAVLVDFNAEWCGPCKKLKPILDTLSDEFAQQVDFFEVDVGKDPLLAQKFSVMSLPTILIFQSGEVKERVIGLLSQDKIRAKIKKII